MGGCARLMVLSCWGLQTLAALPDQDSFYDVTDCLEQQGMEQLVQAHLASKGMDPDLRQQLALYEVRAHGGRPSAGCPWQPRCLPVPACLLTSSLIRRMP